MKKGRKISGGKYHARRKKRKHELGRDSRIVKVGETKGRNIRVCGGKIKRVLLSCDVVNVVDKGKTKKAKIKRVVETPSNRFLARQNVLIKGAVIDTELGRARITNRPGQEGCVQAVLIKED